MMYGMIKLFLSLSLGYVLCILAKKETGILKTVGYTLGISILVISLVSGLIVSSVCMPYMCKMGKIGKMHCPIMSKMAHPSMKK